MTDCGRPVLRVIRTLRLCPIYIILLLGGVLAVRGAAQQSSHAPLWRDAAGELQRMHLTDMALGAPLVVDEFKIIPLAAVGIGSGHKQDAKAQGSIVGSAGLVSPRGVIVISPRGVQLLPVSPGFVEQFLNVVVPVILQVISKNNIDDESEALDSPSQLRWPAILAGLYTLLPENGLEFGLFPWPLGLIILFVLGWLALAVLVGVFLPQQVQAVATTLQENTLRAGLIGMLSYGVAFILAIVFAASIIGIPLSMIVLVFIWALTLLGLIGVASIAGRRIAMMVWHADASQMIAILIGGVLLGVVRVIPVLGWVAWMVLGIFGFGAVVLTRGRMAQPREIEASDS